MFQGLRASQVSCGRHSTHVHTKQVSCYKCGRLDAPEAGCGVGCPVKSKLEIMRKIGEGEAGVCNSRKRVGGDGCQGGNR